MENALTASDRFEVLDTALRAIRPLLTVAERCKASKSLNDAYSVALAAETDAAVSASLKAGLNEMTARWFGR